MGQQASCLNRSDGMCCSNREGAGLSEEDAVLMDLINGIPRAVAEKAAFKAGQTPSPRRAGDNGRVHVDLDLLTDDKRKLLLSRLVEHDALLPECYFDPLEASAIRSGEKRDAARSADTPEARKALSGLVGRCVKATCSKVAGEPFALLQVQYVDQLTETFNLIHFVVLHHYPGGQYTE